jgi:hypothetical protein
MITPGLACAIGDEPYRLVLAHAVDELLARLARDPCMTANAKLKHAIDFATKRAKIEQAIAVENASAPIAPTTPRAPHCRSFPRPSRSGRRGGHRSRTT